ncbi:MAG: hydrogen peroxide-inducible genes activator [Xanthobacteraceae bacterium]|nr:hydrogen peroxide-inducible genes activator [Xanthobacteraceae bacterium]
MLSLKQLRYFDAVARTRHFGKAAEQCAVTQPALSMQIQELERTLGVKLIERSRGRVMLTKAGLDIAARGAGVLAGARDIVDAARAQGDTLAGPLRLGVIPSVAPYVLPVLLPVIRDRHPDLDLHLRETRTRHLIGELDDGGLDLLLMALPVDAPEIATLALFDDRFLLAMPGSRQITHRIHATPELLEQDRLLLLEEGHCLRDQALAFCNLRRADNIDTFGASNLSTIVQMVSNGLGMTLLPEMSIQLECRRSDIRLMRFVEPQPSRTIGLAWRRSSPRARHFTEFGKLIASVMAEPMREARET